MPRGQAGRSARRPAFREPRLRLLVVCGGKRTEPDYFRGLKNQVRNPAVHVSVKAKGIAPWDLVEYARSRAPIRTDEFDEVWCVVDRDEFALQPAATRATQLDVQLAVSNPCFELWLLLHHKDCTAPFGDASAVLCRLRKQVPGYEKTGLRFADFADGVPDALRRAERLDPSGCDYGCDPSTGVWKLARRIVEGGQHP